MGHWVGVCVWGGGWSGNLLSMIASWSLPARLPRRLIREYVPVSVSISGASQLKLADVNYAVHPFAKDGDDKGKRQFSLVSADRTYHLCAESVLTMNAWIQAINSISAATPEGTELRRPTMAGGGR